MTTELFMLALATLLGIVHVFATGQVVVAQHGMAYGLSPRDEEKRVTGVPGRVQRAYANYMQTFPFFAAAVLMAHVAGRHGWLTVTGAELYFVSRLAFVPLYAFGVPVLRSLAFVASMLGTCLILFALI